MSKEANKLANDWENGKSEPKELNYSCDTFIARTTNFCLFCKISCRTQYCVMSQSVPFLRGDERSSRLRATRSSPRSTNNNLRMFELWSIGSSKKMFNSSSLGISEGCLVLNTKCLFWRKVAFLAFEGCQGQTFFAIAIDVLWVELSLNFKWFGRLPWGPTFALSHTALAHFAWKIHAICIHVKSTGGVNQTDKAAVAALQKKKTTPWWHSMCILRKANSWFGMDRLSRTWTIKHIYGRICIECKHRVCCASNQNKHNFFCRVLGSLGFSAHILVVS